MSKLVVFFEILAGILFITGTIMVIIWRVGENKKKAYNDDYKNLSQCIFHGEIDDESFRKIFRGFLNLYKNNQDEFRTQLLWTSFQTKFNEFFERNHLNLERSNCN